jgi:hypothetical protein
MTLSMSGYTQRYVISFVRSPYHGTESSSDQGSPHWDNNWCKASPEETQEKAEQAKEVPVPEHDPIFGLGGHLPKLWKHSIGTEVEGR